LQLEADAPGPNIFNVAIDGAKAATVTLDATVADGTVVEKAAHAAPIALSRGTHRVRIELGADADTCTGTKTDACDGWGIIRGLRLKRVGP
jgi:hypothetical protein